MGYPVFYYIARRYINTDIREDILKFYILQALKPYSARKFDIVFDLTQVEDKNRCKISSFWALLRGVIQFNNHNFVCAFCVETALEISEHVLVFRQQAWLHVTSPEIVAHLKRRSLAEFLIFANFWPFRRISHQHC